MCVCVHLLDELRLKVWLGADELEPLDDVVCECHVVLEVLECVGLESGGLCGLVGAEEGVGELVVCLFYIVSLP